MKFCRQEYWNGLRFPPVGDLPDPGIKPASPELAGRFFTTEPLGKPLIMLFLCLLLSPNFRHMPPGICSRSQTPPLSVNHHFAAAKLLQSCPTLCDPMDSSQQGPLSMEFSRQEHWSGLPCPSPGVLPDPGLNLSLLWLLYQTQILYCWATGEAQTST